MEESTVIIEKAGSVNEECCPRFNPSTWENKNHAWKNKRFITATVPTLFHMPIPLMIGNRVVKLMKKAQLVDALAKDKSDTLLLFYDPHPFKSEMYLSVEKEVPDIKNAFISGNYFSKVYDGPYRFVPKFIKEMDAYLKSNMKKAVKYYVHYAYCPKCAQKEGHNYMVFFAEIE